ncbi:MAG: DUF3575 domain-containing protein [Bacteroidales bacterium]|nr:DUF3575 domain-containing protein [Bacteroidales bacterium]
MLRKFLFIVLWTIVPVGLSAQALSEIWVTSDTLQVYFPQGESILEPEFRNNGESLKKFTENFHQMKETEGSKVMSVLIVSGASPEGRISLNRRLSDERANAVLDYLLEQELLDPSEVDVESRGVDWKGLYTIMEYSDLPYRQDVMAIISGPETDTVKGKVIEVRQKALMNLDNGKVWNEIYDNYFPNLRGTMVMIVWNIKREIKIPAPIVSAPEQVSEPELETAPQPQPEIKQLPEQSPAPAPAWSFAMVAKTNLLYDGMLIPNLGVEFGIWKGLVLDINYMHNIWLRVDYSYWYRVHGAEFGLKYYFNKEKVPFKEGHHVGLYAQMLTFDITGILVDAEPWKFGPMLTYGYTLPITRRLNLDFEVGLGLLFGDVYKYDAVDHLRLLREIEDFAFVPKAGVTLQYLIGKNNYNQKKK